MGKEPFVHMHEMQIALDRQHKMLHDVPCRGIAVWTSVVPGEHFSVESAGIEVG